MSLAVTPFTLFHPGVAEFAEALATMDALDRAIYHSLGVVPLKGRYNPHWAAHSSNMRRVSIADYELMKRLARLPNMPMVAKLIALQFDDGR